MPIKVFGYSLFSIGQQTSATIACFIYIILIAGEIKYPSFVSILHFSCMVNMSFAFFLSDLGLVCSLD